MFSWLKKAEIRIKEFHVPLKIFELICVSNYVESKKNYSIQNGWLPKIQFLLNMTNGIKV